MYANPLPKTESIQWLAKLVSFPKTMGEITATAKEWKFGRGMISFLRSFPEDTKFNSSDDFVTRAEEVEMIIRERYEMPIESIHSLQG